MDTTFTAVAAAAVVGAAVGTACTASRNAHAGPSQDPWSPRPNAGRGPKLKRVPELSSAVSYTYVCEPYSGKIPPAAAGRETRVLHCLRHAQGTHNVAVATEGEKAYSNWKYRDARLTPAGIDQAKTAIPTWRKLTFDSILVSPLSRCLQTAVTAIPSGAGKMFATELIRERYGLNPCDLRREKSELTKEFPGVNFSPLENETDNLWTPEREPLPTLQKRANDFLAFVFESNECGKTVGVVTHNDFLTMLLYDSALIMGPRCE